MIEKYDVDVHRDRCYVILSIILVNTQQINNPDYFLKTQIHELKILTIFLITNLLWQCPGLPSHQTHLASVKGVPYRIDHLVTAKKKS